MTRRWRIERLVPGGEGLARHEDGRRAFVPGAFPGEELEPLRLEEHPQYVRVLEHRRLSASAERVAPPCPEVERCGGCDWMALARPAQLRAKAALVEEALGRVAGLHLPPGPLQVVTGSSALGYRGRVRLHIDEQGRTGFLARGSHRLVPLGACLVAAPEVSAAMGRLRALGGQYGAALGYFREAELRHAPAGPRLSARLWPRDANLGQSAKVRQLLATLRAEPGWTVAVGEEPLPTTELQRWPLPGASLLASPEAFTQVNWELNQRLVAAVVEGALARGAASFLDVYAGAGNFSLPLGAAGLTGVGVEEEGAALQAARRAQREQGLSGVQWLAGDAARRVARLAQARQRFDLIIVDPPRTGARPLLRGLLALGAPSLAMVSCNPVTLARDLEGLAAAYTLEQVTAFDFFPHTHHVEVLCWLGRRAAVGPC